MLSALQTHPGTDCRGRGCDGWYGDLCVTGRRVDDYSSRAAQVKTVKYSKSIERAHEEVEGSQGELGKKDRAELNRGRS